MQLVHPDEIRACFSMALSDMYRAEVPLYGDLLSIVAGINAQSEHDERGSSRVAVERHGAIRLGRPDELAIIGRLFAIMGMVPVGYYDLAPSGVPVHSTAFRPIDDASLARNPFRMFTSLLRPELIDDAALRREVERLLSERRIVTPRASVLIETAEKEGGLSKEEAAEFIREALETFRWNAQAAVSRATYDRLRAAHPLIADVVCFKGPHVNHLTPRTFDIDAVHACMRARLMEPKSTIEGPPRRKIPILLRQTSFKARVEQIDFRGEAGTHTARFGEVEQRGAALTRKGRALYDRLLTLDEPDAFRHFPDDLTTLRHEELIFCRYQNGVVEAITYEDFLPVSAAGIFRSNLLGANQAAVSQRPGDRFVFEAALGQGVHDEMTLYADIETRSRIGTEMVSGSSGSSTPTRVGTLH